MAESRRPRGDYPFNEEGTEVKERDEYRHMKNLEKQAATSRGLKARGPSPERDEDTSDSVETELRRLSAYLEELHGAIESHSQALRPILANQEESAPVMDGFMVSESSSEVRNRIIQSTNVVISAIGRIRSLTHDVDL